MTNTTTQRGYGHRHQKQRAHLMRQLTDASPCPVCGKPRYRDPARNFDGAALEADHHKQPLKYATNKHTALADRLIHRTCNRAGGAWDTPTVPERVEPPAFNWQAMQ